MKTKTSELTGVQLDYAVAAIEYGVDQYGKTWGEHAHSKQITVPERKDYIYSPSTKWDQGGPIIERERIRLDCPWEGSYNASCKIDGVTAWASGATALIAAMRSYVASKLGDEVEIPEELA